MKLKFLFAVFLFLIISNNVFAHKDRIVDETYGNVKIYLKTGFEYSEINKIKIIGILSEKLSQKLNYKDTLLIEYVNDYADYIPEDLYTFENNNTNLKFISDYNNEYMPSDYIREYMENYVPEKSDIQIKEKNYGISLRINANRIDIQQILKLIEYAIRNRKTINSELELKKIELKDNVIDTVYNYNVNVIPKRLLGHIISNKSDLVGELIKETINLNTEGHSLITEYWKENEFIFEFKLPHSNTERQFKIKDYYYSTYISDISLLVFIDKENFYYLHPENKSEKLIHIDNGTFWPFSAMNVFIKQVILFNDSMKINIFLTDKNKVVSKFE